MNPVYKKVLLYAAAVLFFAALSCAFVPQAVFKGEIVQSPDITGYVGASHEAKQWDEYHPEDKTALTGSMFGGMPTILLTGSHPCSKRSAMPDAGRPAICSSPCWAPSC